MARFCYTRSSFSLKFFFTLLYPPISFLAALLCSFPEFTMAVSMSSCQILSSNLASSPASFSVGSSEKLNCSVSFQFVALDSRSNFGLSIKARKSISTLKVATQDSLSDIEDSDLPLFPISSNAEKKDCPAGLQRYETMVVLRPDLSEEERVSLTERYEEDLVAGGAVDIEMFNRGMQPLAYRIKTKNMVGALAQYEDGIFILFTYVTKPESQLGLQLKFNADDDVIRSTTFKLKA